MHVRVEVRHSGGERTYGYTLNPPGSKDAGRDPDWDFKNQLYRYIVIATVRCTAVVALSCLSLDVAASFVSVCDVVSFVFCVRLSVSFCAVVCAQGAPGEQLQPLAAPHHLR